MRTFKLHSHPEYGFYAGTTHDKRQVLAGPDGAALIAVSFDSSGTFLEVTETSYEGEEQAEEALQSWLVSVGFEDRPISIKRFFLEGRFIGIEEMPAEYADFVEDSSGYSSEERVRISENIRRWRDRRDFVLWWNEDYWCDVEGFVHSS